MNETTGSAHVYKSYLQYKEINKRVLFVINGMLFTLPASDDLVTLTYVVVIYIAAF